MTPLEFEAANGPLWSEFEQLLSKDDKALEPERFLALYRSSCEHLALAQARGFPGHVVERLSIMTARGHQIVYRQSEFGLARMGRLLFDQFPRTVRAHWRYVLIAFLLLMGPTLALGLAVYARPELVLSLVDGRTARGFEEMYSPTAHVIGRARDAGSDWMMFGFYIMNNVGSAFQCYVTGVVFGVGSLFFLVYNGAFGGAVAGYVTALGDAGTFYPFVATHSAFELTAIVLSGAAGLRLGHSVLLPGRLRRVHSLQAAARDTSVLMVGAAVMLLIAAAVEAFWSSTTWVEPPAKYAAARRLLDSGGAVLSKAAACKLKPCRWCCAHAPMWEGCDLGVRLLQSRLRSVYPCYLAVALPVFLLCYATVGIFSWLPALLIWMLKPWLDRTILFALSRALFGEHTVLADVWAARREVWGSQLAATLTLRRLSASRAFTQPIRQLEGLTGRACAARVRQLAMRHRGVRPHGDAKRSPRPSSRCS